MTPIICENNIETVLKRIQEYLKEDTIKGIEIVDQTDAKIVLLIDKNPIGKEKAIIWWEGFQSALLTGM